MKQSLNLFAMLQNGARLVIVGLALVVGLTACGGQTANLAEASKQAISLDDVVMPADIKLATAAVLMRIKGFEDGTLLGVSFPQQAAQDMQLVNLDYDGFVMKGVLILNYQPFENGTELAALMVFEDAVGRRTGVRYLVQYHGVGDGIAITHASVVQVYTMTPRVEAYVVPFNPNVDQNAISADHNTLYTYALSHGVPVTQLPSGTGDYDVFMFVMDRSSDTAQTKGRISKNDLREHGFEDATTILDFNGWKVAVISGEIDPRANNTLYAKLLHTPGDEAAWFQRSARMRGLFGLTVKTLNVASNP